MILSWVLANVETLAWRVNAAVRICIYIFLPRKPLAIGVTNSLDHRLVMERIANLGIRSIGATTVAL